MDDRITVRHESASAVLKKHESEDSRYEVTRVYAGKRQIGHGTGLMESVTKFADNNGLELYLTVRPYKSVADKVMDRPLLVKFYRKFGFETFGFATAAEPIMIRKPTIIHCDSCGRRMVLGDGYNNVGDSFDVVIYCDECVVKLQTEIQDAKEKSMTDNMPRVPNTMVIRINNPAGKMIGYLDVDREGIPSEAMLPTFEDELTQLVRERLGQEVSIQLLDRELEKFGLRKTPEGNLESV